MTNRVQTVRSNVSGNRPTGRPPGELYVNWADAQIGTITPTNAAQDLIPVRFFQTTANYVIGDFVVQGGQLYRAVAPSAPGAFKPANWGQIGGSITTGDAAPATPQPGTLWWDSVGGQLYVWYSDANSSQWVIAVNTANFPSITIGATPPLNPSVGAQWFDSIGAQLYIWYQDPNSSQWVPTSNQLAGGYMPLIGVVDGTDAPPGQVGEVLSGVNTTGVSMPSGAASNLIAIALTPGDWDIFGESWFAGTVAAASVFNACLTPISGTFPTAPAMNSSRGQITYTVSGGFSACQLALSPCRASLTVATTYYLAAGATYSTGACTVYGKIWARRAR